LCNGNGFTEDEEGCDLPDLASARERAIAGLRDVLAGELRNGEIDLGSFIEIEDQDHAHLMTVPFAEAVRLTTEHAKRP
jgi:hypothetical protein